MKDEIQLIERGRQGDETALGCMANLLYDISGTVTVMGDKSVIVWVNGNMTQDERWKLKYNEVMLFMEKEHR